MCFGILTVNQHDYVLEMNLNNQCSEAHVATKAGSRSLLLILRRWPLRKKDVRRSKEKQSEQVRGGLNYLMSSG